MVISLDNGQDDDIAGILELAELLPCPHKRAKTTIVSTPVSSQSAQRHGTSSVDIKFVGLTL